MHVLTLPPPLPPLGDFMVCLFFFLENHTLWHSSTSEAASAHESVHHAAAYDPTFSLCAKCSQQQRKTADVRVGCCLPQMLCRLWHVCLRLLSREQSRCFTNHITASFFFFFKCHCCHCVSSYRTPSIENATAWAHSLFFCYSSLFRYLHTNPYSQNSDRGKSIRGNVPGKVLCRRQS